MTAAPGARLPGTRSNLKISRAPSSPIALVASSSNKTGGLRSKTLAMAKRCCSPPDKSMAQSPFSSRPRPCTVLSLTAASAPRTASSEKSASHSG
mmetsp:Transcript_18165/g.31887  ORF Transcript_18165/g.31887 Transcript_18165/m.31887 type:complete len:95 (+) Transcript_18165:126-410(+)